MYVTTRLSALVAVAACALAAAGTSSAASSALAVRSSTRVLGRAGAVTIATQQDPSAYRTTVLAPAAYQLRAAGRVGATIGSAAVHVLTASGPLTFTGWVVREYAAGFVDDSCADFAGYSHLAVWLLQVRQTDGLARAEIPVFVDAAPGGRTELTWCASSAADMTVTGVTLSLARAFANPVRHGAYAWQALYDLTASQRSIAGRSPTSARAIVRL